MELDRHWGVNRKNKGVNLVMDGFSSPRVLKRGSPGNTIVAAIASVASFIECLVKSTVTDERQVSTLFTEFITQGRGVG